MACWQSRTPTGVPRGLFTESSPVTGGTKPYDDKPMKACAYCGASLADDQRYCLECGSRQMQSRSQFLHNFTPATAARSGASGVAHGPGMSGVVPSGPAARSPRSANTTALAGIGVLLLAMGVGVLIGRASGKSSASAPPQVISVSSPTAAGGTTGTGTEASGEGATGGAEIPEDWPAGKSGYTIRLQTLPSATAQATEVTAAKSSAQTKGATGVGILLSSNYTSLPADEYVIYSGDYGGEAQAKRGLSKLKAKFPSATVIRVSASGASSSGVQSPSSSQSSSSASKAGGSGGKGGGSSGSSKSGSSNSGGDAEQKSLSLPNTVTTG